MKATRPKVTLRYRGREMAHQEFGVRLIERVEAGSRAARGGGAVSKMEGRAIDHGVGPRRARKKSKAGQKEAKKEPKKEPKPEVSL